MNELNAISIRQPWLDLILKGKKKLELRDWNTPHRGTIALHSPMKIDLHASHYYGYNEPWKLERGKVLGIANIVTSNELNEMDYAKNLAEHLSIFPFPGIIYAIRFADIITLPRPVPAKGKLLIFPLEESIRERILNQLPPHLSSHQT